MEKNYGVVKVDYRGRLVLPAKLRDEVKLYEAYVEVIADIDTDIITLIRKQNIEKQGACVFCGRKSPVLKELLGKHICLDCYNALK